ncbi:MAG: translation initiation factor IF-2 [Alphaproteobacteria bacterium]
MAETNKDKDSNTETKSTPKAESGRKRLQLSDKALETGQITQSFSHRRTKTVQVEVRRRQPGAKTKTKTKAKTTTPKIKAREPEKTAPNSRRDLSPRSDKLSQHEQQARAQALEQAKMQEAQKHAREEAERVAQLAREKKVVPEKEPESSTNKMHDMQDSRGARSPHSTRESRQVARAAREGGRDETTRPARPVRPGQHDGEHATTARHRPQSEDAKARTPEKSSEKTAREEDDKQRKSKRKQPRAPGVARKRDEPKRRSGKLTIAQALEGEEYELRMRSLAAMRRKREKERQHNLEHLQEGARVVREVTLPETIEIQELALRMAERTEDVLSRLQQLGINVMREDIIDADTAEIIISEYGHKTRRVSEYDLEEGISGKEDEAEDLLPRPPVVTVMGHVDHGKTSILDAIRKSDQAAKEAGGITQHIGASFVELKDGKKICFIDTPGHTAFTALRARGANVTDIVVLVVAADDGVKEQTREAYNHAKAANATILVAINKIDKPDANPDKVKRELLELGLVPEDMGGDVLVVQTSAQNKTGIDDLLEAIFLQGELLNLRANPKRNAQGVVLEAKREQGRGAVATVLIQRGTLKVGQNFIAGIECGRVRALADWRAKKIKQATPSEPVEVIGLGDVPNAGDDFIVVDSDQRANEIASDRKLARRQAHFVSNHKPIATDPDEILRQMEENALHKPNLNLIIKADVHGSAEAVQQAIQKLANEEISLQILHVGVGGINESDVLLANTTNAEILGFNVRAAPKARTLAQRDAIPIQHYSTIYELLDNVQEKLDGQLRPKTKETTLGEAEIREVFDVSKAGKVAGCQVIDGLLKRSARARVIREGEILHDGKMRSLKRFKDEASEVKQGLECGLAFENFQGFQIGDRIECYEVKEVT